MGRNTISATLGWRLFFLLMRLFAFASYWRTPFIQHFEFCTESILASSPQKGGDNPEVKVRLAVDLNGSMREGRSQGWLWDAGLHSVVI